MRHRALQPQDHDGPREAGDATVPSIAEQSGTERAGSGGRSGASGIAPPEAVDDLGGFAPGHRGVKPGTWMLLAASVVVAAILWVADRQRREADH